MPSSPRSHSPDARIVQHKRVLVQGPSLPDNQGTAIVNSSNVSINQYLKDKDVNTLSAVQKVHNDKSGKRVGKTCTWLLERPEFINWEAGSDPVLWLHGPRGSGKSILVSTVIDYLVGLGDNRVFYFYMKGNDVSLQDEKAVWWTFYNHIGSESMSIDVSGQDSTGKRHGQDASRHQLQTAWREYLDSPSDKPVYIIIDALDEFNNNAMVEVLKELVEIISKNGTDSRRVSVLISSSTANQTIYLTQAVHVPITDKDNAGDIGTYLQHRLDSLLPNHPDKERRGTLCQRALDKLTENVGVMFLCAKYQADAICRKHTEESVNSFLRGLDKATSITSYYTEIAANFDSYQDPKERDLAWNAMFFMSHSSGSLSRHALQLALDSDEHPTTMCNLCKNLLEFDDSLNVFKTCHGTVQDFFRGRPGCDAFVARASLRYLNSSRHPKLEGFEPHWFNEALLQPYLDEHPLLEYASCNWHRCARGSMDQSKPLIKTLCRSRKQMQLAFQIHMAKANREVPDHISCAQILSYYALNDMLKELERGLLDTLRVDSYNRTALHWALKGLIAAREEDGDGFRDTRQETKRGSWLDNPSTRGKSSSKDHHALELVTTLVQNGVCVKAQDTSGRTPLHYAAQSGHQEVVEYLVKKGARVNAQDPHHGTPLVLASRSGHDKIVRFFLGENATVFDECSFHGNALIAAASGCSQHSPKLPFLLIFDLLIEAGIDVNAKAGWAETALHAVAKHGHSDLVLRLLTCGAKVETKNRDGLTAADVARNHGHPDVADIIAVRLSDNGASDPAGDDQFVEPARILRVYDRPPNPHHLISLHDLISRRYTALRRHDNSEPRRHPIAAIPVPFIWLFMIPTGQLVGAWYGETLNIAFAFMYPIIPSVAYYTIAAYNRVALRDLQDDQSDQLVAFLESQVSSQEDLSARVQHLARICAELLSEAMEQNPDSQDMAEWLAELMVVTLVGIEESWPSRKTGIMARIRQATVGLRDALMGSKRSPAVACVAGVEIVKQAAMMRNARLVELMSGILTQKWTAAVRQGLREPIDRALRSIKQQLKECWTADVQRHGEALALAAGCMGLLCTAIRQHEQGGDAHSGVVLWKLIEMVDQTISWAAETESDFLSLVASKEIAEAALVEEEEEEEEPAEGTTTLERPESSELHQLRVDFLFHMVVRVVGKAIRANDPVVGVSLERIAKRIIGMVDAESPIAKALSRVLERNVQIAAATRRLVDFIKDHAAAPAPSAVMQFVAYILRLFQEDATRNTLPPVLVQAERDFLPMLRQYPILHSSNSIIVLSEGS